MFVRGGVDHVVEGERRRWNVKPSCAGIQDLDGEDLQSRSHAGENKGCKNKGFHLS